MYSKGLKKQIASSLIVQSHTWKIIQMEITIIYLIIFTLSLVIARIQPPSTDFESEIIDKFLINKL